MIAIIKYNAGNIASVQNTLDHLGYPCIVTDRESDILNADKVIFPGVGEASSAMQYLQKRNMDVLIKSLKQPVLGICLGQQLMCAHSEEGDVDCLNIFDAGVRKFPPDDIVPHMGWNNLHQTRSELFSELRDDEDFYFVHSYYCELSAETVAACDYILPFSAAMQKENFYAVQFHPEKSAASGAKLLLNFLQL
jgi:imidazole glycerol-phosphate synthase subunit HisH